MQNLIIIAFVALSGIGLPVQDALNSQLRGAVKSPLLGALISFVFAALIVALLVATGIMGRGKLSDALHAPWYVIVGGSALSVLAVVAGLLSVSKVSAGVTIAVQVVAELLAAVIIDHFGWLGVPQVRLNAWRVAGAILLCIGGVLMQKK